MSDDIVIAESLLLTPKYRPELLARRFVEFPTDCMGLLGQFLVHGDLPPALDLDQTLAHRLGYAVIETAIINRPLKNPSLVSLTSGTI